MPKEPSDELQIFKRRLPHWRREGSTYFVTFRLREGTLNRDELRVVRTTLEAGHRKHYVLHAAIIMPDHVHALLEPADGMELSRILKGIKGVSARMINQARGSSGALWQDESWDRIVRTEKEFLEKMKYMFNNPLKKGVCEDPAAYEGWILPSQ